MGRPPSVTEKDLLQGSWSHLRDHVSGRMGNEKKERELGRTFFGRQDNTSEIGEGRLGGSTIT